MNVKIIYLIKVITINLLVIIFLIVSIELIAAFGRFVISKKVLIPYFNFQNYSENFIKSPRHPCNEMKTDVLLDIVPHTRNKCFPRGGVVFEDYVLYDANNKLDSVILTLGGSTTSGFYQYFSNGETWPKILADISKNKYSVINGGVGGYSSLQELYKFTRDGPRIKNLRIAISLNGINDMQDIFGVNKLRAQAYPFLTQKQFTMNATQRWIDSRVPLSYYITEILPNASSLLILLSKKKAVSEPSVNHFRQLDAADRWENNVIRLNALSRADGIIYYLFLQPTLGLEGIQSTPRFDSNDERLYKSLDESYLNEIRGLYKELKKRCSQLDFCYDISDVAPPDGNNYHDPRHHNEFGNLIIANEIWKTIQVKQKN